MGKLGLSEGENSTVKVVHTGNGIWHERSTLLIGKVLKKRLNGHQLGTLVSGFLYLGEVEPNDLQDPYHLSSFIIPSIKGTQTFRDFHWQPNIIACHIILQWVGQKNGQ